MTATQASEALASTHQQAGMNDQGRARNVKKPGSVKKRPDADEVEEVPGENSIPKKQPKKNTGGKSRAKEPTRPRKSAARKSKDAKADAAEEKQEKPAEPSKPPEPAKPTKPELKPREKVREAMPGIIDAIIKKAKKGSCQHFKSLLEQYPEAGSEDERAKQESLTELLLEELKG